jgi:translation initiation factor 4E
LYDSSQALPQNAKGDHSWYEKIVKPIATVRSVEEFWACYSHLVRPNELVSPSDYHLFKYVIKHKRNSVCVFFLFLLFRQGISPLWEDESNQKGGKWMVRLRKGVKAETFFFFF